MHEYAEQLTDATTLELQAIDRQVARFGKLSLLAILVSFVHMAAALSLFSGAAWYELGAALAMTALVDVATWALAGYFDYAARRQLSRSGWIMATFGLALAISMFLNGVYLYAHRPPSLPGWMSASIAVAFAVFVPLLIGVASLIRGELETDRLRVQQQAAATPRVVANSSVSRTPPRRITGARPHGLTVANTGTARANVVEAEADATPQTAPTLAAPLANSAPSGAQISTSDPTAIVAVLHAANVREFASARVLAQICGWRSSSSGPKALRTLQIAGVVRETGGVFVLETAQIAQQEG